MGSKTAFSTFSNIQKEEFKRIKERRKLAGFSNRGNPEKDAIGLALSGGGIRSATFNLGILQALERCGILKYVDYLSTVSGGGYIGSSLTWFMSRLRKAFPFGMSRGDNADFPGKLVARLRARGSYLTPGDGLTWWALAATIIIGILINLMVVIPAFFCAIWILQRCMPAWPPYISFLISRLTFATSIKPTLFIWILFLGMVCIFAFTIIAVSFSLTTRIPCMYRYTAQRRTNKAQGKILMFGVLLLVIGTVPIVHTFISTHLQGWIKTAMSSISLAGVLSAFSALIGKKSGNEAKGVRSFLLSIGLSLAVYGIFLWIYHLTDKNVISPITYLLALLGSFILAIVADINQVSMHRFYRNRLMEAYIPYELSKSEPITDETVKQPLNAREADLCKICDIPQTAAPYQIINTNIQTVGSPRSKLRERGGDNFIFSPLFCGSESTGYLHTRDYIKGKTNLATAMAISGAAVDPNTYATRSRPLSFFMTLLNIRLGYWIRNPLFNDKTRAILWRNPTWYSIFIEMFGRGLHEKRWNIHLSDGGHFENLGLYELIKRRCRCIIVCDATADPDYQFGDLGKVIEMVRVDFGAKVEIVTTSLIPADKTNKISQSAWATGAITYENGDKAHLIYITTTLINNLPEDIYTYQRKNPSFPDQGTGDQFFDERQFEAYRELGFQIGDRFFHNSASICDSGDTRSQSQSGSDPTSFLIFQEI